MYHVTSTASATVLLQQLNLLGYIITYTTRPHNFLPPFAKNIYSIYKSTMIQSNTVNLDEVSMPLHTSYNPHDYYDYGLP